MDEQRKSCLGCKYYKEGIPYDPQCWFNSKFYMLLRKGELNIPVNCPLKQRRIPQAYLVNGNQGYNPLEHEYRRDI